MTDRLRSFAIRAYGRPAPQGSKKLGAAGQMREASVHLPAWRAAVKRATYEAYKAAGIEPAALPYLRGSVGVQLTFWMPDGVPVIGPPDLDKLQRSTWDALTQARVWEDDGRVTFAVAVEKRAPSPRVAGVEILVWERGTRGDTDG